MHKLGKAEISTHYTPAPDWNTAPAQKYCYAPNSAKECKTKVGVRWHFQRRMMITRYCCSSEAPSEHFNQQLETFLVLSLEAKALQTLQSCFFFLSLKITSLFLFFIFDSWEAQFYTNFTSCLKYTLLTPPRMPFQSTQAFSQLSLGWAFFLGAVHVMEKANPLHLTSEMLHSTPCIFSNFLGEYKEGIFKTDNKNHVLLVENCQEVCRKTNCSRLILSGN